MNEGETKGSKLHFQQQIRWKDVDPVRFIGYSAVFTAGVDMLAYPFEVIRTRMQAQHMYLSSGKNFTGFPVYRTTFHGFQSIFRAEGLRGLFKGFMVAETADVIANVTYYVGYEILKQNLQSNKTFSQSTTFWSTFVAGGVCEAFVVGLAMPADVITARLQVQGAQNSQEGYHHARSAYSTIMKNEGIKGLFRGTGASILKFAPHSAIWWGSYEWGKAVLHDMDLRASIGMKPYQPEAFHYQPKTKENDEEEDGFLVKVMKGMADDDDDDDDDPTPHVEIEDPLFHLVSGFSAGVIATVVTNPVDVVRTRLMVHDGNHRSAFKTFSHMLRHEGARSIWKGLTPNLIVNVPSGIITVILFEYVKKLSII